MKKVLITIAFITTFSLSSQTFVEIKGGLMKLNNKHLGMTSGASVEQRFNKVGVRGSFNMVNVPIHKYDSYSLELTTTIVETGIYTLKFGSGVSYDTANWYEKDGFGTIFNIANIVEIQDGVAVSLNIGSQNRGGMNLMKISVGIILDLNLKRKGSSVNRFF